MPNCLYCQQDNPSKQVECDNCGRPLPEHADNAPERRQRRFMNQWHIGENKSFDRYGADHREMEGGQALIGVASSRPIPGPRSSLASSLAAKGMSRW